MSPDPSMAAQLSVRQVPVDLFFEDRRAWPLTCRSIWNDDTNPAQDAKYTTNINTEMNYWPVESGNLSECSEPRVSHDQGTTDQGIARLREHYGAGGWVFHQNTDIWRGSRAMDGPTWGIYRWRGMAVHSGSITNTRWIPRFLREAYQQLRLCTILYGFLVMHPNGKWLVTNPSASRKTFLMAAANKPYFDEVTAGTTEKVPLFVLALPSIWKYCTTSLDIISLPMCWPIKTILLSRLNLRGKIGSPQVGKRIVHYRNGPMTGKSLRHITAIFLAHVWFVPKVKIV